jgi:hypothetical protein
MQRRQAILANKNLKPPPDPFEEEEKALELKPSSAWVDRQIDKWFEDEESKIHAKGLETPEKFATLNALKMHKLGRTVEKMGGQKEKQFLTDFDAWLIGAGRPEDSMKTPWGR